MDNFAACNVRNWYLFRLQRNPLELVFRRSNICSFTAECFGLILFPSLFPPSSGSFGKHKLSLQNPSSPLLSICDGFDTTTVTFFVLSHQIDNVVCEQVTPSMFSADARDKEPSLKVVTARDAEAWRDFWPTRLIFGALCHRMECRVSLAFCVFPRVTAEHNSILANFWNTSMTRASF